jgi:hypothetical protein
LLFAGRNISASHIAFTSTRVMATCGMVGQGVGTAAALCTQTGVDPVDLVGNRQKLRDLQQTLLRNDCFLIGVRNEDPVDMARSAKISNSSSAPEFPSPDRVISGATHCVHAEGGECPMDKCSPAFRPPSPSNGWWMSVESFLRDRREGRIRPSRYQTELA